MIKYTQYANKSDSVTREIESIIAKGKTPFQEYLFFNSKTNGVCIAIDGDIQSTQIDEKIYHEALTHPALALHENPKNVLIMGGGEGATAREILKHKSIEKVVMVDIDEEFVQVCKKYAPTWSDGCFEDERLEVLYMDIKEYLDKTDVGFDVVIGDLVDVDDWDDFLASLYAEDFYTKLKKVLNPGAIVATQAGALNTLDNQGHKHIRANLRSVFENVQTYGVVVPSFYSLWGYVLASDETITPDKMHERLKEAKVVLDGIGNENLSSLFNLPSMIRKSYE